MSRLDLIELDPTHAVHVVLCSNPETVCDGTELAHADSVTEQEATSAACAAANEEIWQHLHGFGDYDSFFANWHGGKYRRADLNGGLIVANLFSRDDPEDEDGCYGDWEWCGVEGFNLDLIQKVQAALDAAQAAATRELEQWEKAQTDNHVT